VILQAVDDPSSDREPIEASVEREVRPGIRVPLLRGRREVRRVRQDAVESPESVSEVRTHRPDREAHRERRSTEHGQGVRVSVGGDHPPARARGRERERAVARPEVEEPAAPGPRGEREEQERVLPHRIHRGVDGDGDVGS
jgi:hypothetical protein